MSGLKAKIDKAEIAIFPTKSGGVDQKILDKEGLWFKVFGEMPRIG